MGQDVREDHGIAPPLRNPSAARLQPAEALRRTGTSLVEYSWNILYVHTIHYCINWNKVGSLDFRTLYVAPANQEGWCVAVGWVISMVNRAAWFVNVSFR